MLKATAWSLLSGGLLAAGFAYAYAHTRRANARRVAGDSSPRSLLEADLRAEALREALEEPWSEGGEEIEIELLDIDSAEERGEAYDASSPDELGALWLARATQTSGEHTSTSIDDDAFEDEDVDLDPAGRPTEPPEEPRDAPHKPSR